MGSTKQLFIKLEELNIYINKLKSQKQSGFFGAIGILLMIISVLLLLPILILFMIFGAVNNLIMPRKTDKVNAPYWLSVQTSSNMEIGYHWLKPDEVPENLLELYEERGLMIFKTDPCVEFFDGYFTDFKVERDDGIFVQKVIFDTNQKAIHSAPLIFFRYRDGELENIVDLYGYEFDSKGNPNDFLISANGKGESFEVRITK